MPQTEPAPNVATPLPSAFSNTHAPGVTMASRQLFDAPAESEQPQPPDPIQFAELDGPDCNVETMNSLALNAMLDGSDQVFQQSSKDVYDALFSTTFVPPAMADQKKNKAVSVHAFVSRVKEFDPQIIFPAEQQGKLLRSILKTMVSEVKGEYKTVIHLLVTSRQCTICIGCAITDSPCCQDPGPITSLHVLPE